MSEPVSHLLDLFDALAAADKQSVATEIIRRSPPSAADIPDAGFDALAEELRAPAPRPASLADLLAGITPENLHVEWAPGPPVGAEQL